MTELLKAILSRFTSQLLATITGGLHATRSATAATPYCVYDVVSAPNAQVYGAGGQATVLIQFTVWHTSSASALALAESLASAMTASLTLGGGQKNVTTRVIGRPLPSPGSADEQELGEWTFGWSAQIEFTIA